MSVEDKKHRSHLPMATPERTGLCIRIAGYTAHDMASFARDMGYVDKKGRVKPPFIWETSSRRWFSASRSETRFCAPGIGGIRVENVSNFVFVENAVEI